MNERPSAALFGYPGQAVVDRILPKAKLYEHARVGAALREKFVAQVGQITWRYKLAPETIHLPARAGVLEIQVFALTLKGDDLDEDVLRAIDRAIPHPILFELNGGNRVRMAAAYKRPSQADMDKWVLDGYLSGPWLPQHAARRPLPIALDLCGLYEQLLRSLPPLPAREGESLPDQIARHAALRKRQAEARMLEAQMRRERQFNRKVALNARLRDVKQEIDSLGGTDGRGPCAR